MEPIDPSHPPARHVKHHAVYINPEGPQPILSQLTPLSPSWSPDIPVISTASLRSISTVSTSPTRAPPPPNTVSHIARPPPALAHPDRRTLALRLLLTRLGYLEIYDNSARVKGTKGSHKKA
ncbi:hypothetical protein INS49_015242 [Diaporthe citri]|uniref:uncharacterized protein n=1 Tax=Diaporthe citri TaxID=83186 RepID=UPI001C822415|nr:uncharacterized protein INS49_015242 [Diaporthe citri]KAG6355858.1 hypothetical protein INS49_015242 [Diaporthe citri]